MPKLVIIAIVIVLFILVAWVAYYLISSLNQGENQIGKQSDDRDSFDVQGVKVQILSRGTEPAVRVNDVVSIHYNGMLADGTKFDSSYDKQKPLSFTVGEGELIKGMDLGVNGMKIGEKRKLTIPPELAYGQLGIPSIIPANATLIFEVELLSIIGKRVPTN